jgi:hypothetical protein
MPFLKSAEANSPARQTEDGGAASPIPRPAKKKRYYERFAQQELRGWSPVITGGCVLRKGSRSVRSNMLQVYESLDLQDIVESHPNRSRKDEIIVVMTSIWSAL